MNREQPMMRGLAAISALLAAALWASEAGAWASANRFGGATQHSWGETSHENRWGGSTEHVAGEGTEHTNVYGGTTAGRYGEGAYHAGPGGAAYRPPVYPVYHPPVAVPAYTAGCYGCAAAAGAVVGVAAGAAVASANTAAATSNAYAAGVAAGAAVSYSMGANYATLPPGSTPATVAGTTYYISGNTWFKPMYGANGVYYRVVPTP